MNVAEEIAQARSALAEGHQTEASRLLHHAAFETLDPELLKQIHELALEGREKAGRIRKRMLWDHILTETELRGQRPQG